jgi:hypothetical protein
MAVFEFPVKIGRVPSQIPLKKCRRSKFRVRGYPPLRIEFGSASLVLRIVAVLTSIDFAHQKRYVKKVQATKAAVPTSSSEIARP